jgi:hypothetical protein
MRRFLSAPWTRSLLGPWGCIRFSLLYSVTFWGTRSLCGLVFLGAAFFLALKGKFAKRSSLEDPGRGKSTHGVFCLVGWDLCGVGFEEEADAGTWDGVGFGVGSGSAFLLKTNYKKSGGLHISLLGDWSRFVFLKQIREGNTNTVLC